MNDPVIGVVGTGHFSSYLIAALRNGGHAGRILLSPYSRDKAERLARENACEVAADDRHLAAEADWLLIAVRADQLDAALEKLHPRPEQIVLSAVAGVPVDSLGRRMTGARTFVRLMPSSYVESMRGGLIPLFPSVEAVETVLSRAGTVLPFETEEQFDLATVGACMSGWIYRFVDPMVEWFTGKGLSADRARLLVTGNMAGALAHAQASRDSLDEISDGIATEGTYTRAGLEILLAQGMSEPWVKALDEVFKKLRAGAKPTDG